MKESAYIREAIQRPRRGVRPAGVHDHAGRGDVDAPRKNRGARRDAAVSATAMKSHISIRQVCALPMAVSKCGVPELGR
ncbi:hypothetical protein, partial [Mycobacterium sp.]|uniref:hypothetical protein n=1 Tax=Mycobacterium sp. TaxID=1785 RepID=UPI003F970CA3